MTLLMSIAEPWEKKAIHGRQALLGSVIAGINAVCPMRTNRLS